MKKIIIAAVSQNFVLAKDGKIPWYSKSELEHFKNSTLGFPVIMGRKTWQTLKLPLPGRLNIVISRNEDLYVPAEARKYFSLNEAINHCSVQGYEKCFIIGGAEIINHAIGIADEIILSIMKFESEGDRFFPKIDSKIWKEDAIQDFEEYRIHTYIRINDLKEKDS